jgi:hypothetical protein
MSDVTPIRADMRPVTSYVFACPRCRSVHQLEERDLELARPEEFRLKHECTHCGSWTPVTVTGPYRELKVEKCAAPAAVQ